VAELISQLVMWGSGIGFTAYYVGARHWVQCSLDEGGSTGFTASYVLQQHCSRCSLCDSGSTGITACYVEAAALFSMFVR